MGSSKKHKAEKEKEREREVRKRHRSRSRSRSKERDSRHNRRDRRDRSKDRSSRSRSPKEKDNRRRYDEKSKKEEKSDSDSEIRTSGAGESSLSIEETNKLRAKLGLKPLDVSEDDKHKFEKEFVHVPAENWGDKAMFQKMRERIAVQKDRRKILDKLRQTKGLADSDSDEEGAVTWILKSRKIQEEKEKADKREKMLAEMDEEFGVGNLIEDEMKKLKDKAYTSRDLKGIKVEHSQDRFLEGKAIILTLKDKDVLNEDEDVLVNVNLIDNEKAEKNVELRTKKPGYDAYEEPVDEFGNLLAKKPILKKYDEEIDGVKKDHFALGSGGAVDIERQNQLLEIRKKLHMKHTESLSLPSPKIASEYFTNDEMVKFKKPKKIVRKVRRSKRLKADELAQLNDSAAADPKEDFGSRSGKSLSSEIKQEPTEIKEETDESLDTGGWVMAEDVKEEPKEIKKEKEENENDDIDDDVDDEDDLMGPDEDLTGVPVEPDEAELELQLALNKARRLKHVEGKGKKDFNAALNSNVSMDEDMDDETKAKSTKGFIVMNATAEFCRALGDIPTYGMSGNRDEDIDDLMELERDMPAADDKRLIEEDNKPNNGGWNEVLSDEKPPEVTIDDVPILEEEPDVSVGLAGALKLAMKKGYLEKESKKMASAPRHSQLQAANYTIEDKSYNEDDKFGRRDRYSAGPITDFKEKDQYKPDVKLEYIDDSGRLLTPKEAFRYLSHKFHGKGSGKNKTEKRMKKLQEEVLMKQMSSTDTPLGTLALLQEKQKQTQSPYILLSGGNKALNPNAISKPV